MMAGLLPILLIIGIFYLLIYRPMRRRQRAVETMIAGLKNGDKVITNGGVYGTVAGVKENTVLLKVADQVKIEVAKASISSLQSPQRNPSK
jgi:preprotein translocase subunit YajC